MTQAGHEGSPQWSPDGQWIAFLSERKSGDAKDSDSADSGDSKARGQRGTSNNDDKNKDKSKSPDKDKDVAQLYLISPHGGEAFAITSGDEEVHAFAWSSDSESIVFATREPWNKQQNDEHKKMWKDVIQYRGDERGDVIFRITLENALAQHAALGSKEISETEKDSGTTPGLATLARTPLRVDQMTISHDGKSLAYVTSSVSERQEKVEDVDLYLVNLTSAATPAAESAPVRLTRNEAVELNLSWAPDNRHVFFQTNLGSAEGKYEDPQPRLYWVDATGASDNKPIQRWFSDYPGEVVHYTVLADGSVLCACRLGTEVQFSTQANPKAPIVKRDGWPGTYEAPSTASPTQSVRIAFAYSATTRPTEVYLAEGPDKFPQARPITSFNKLFTERDLPQGQTLSLDLRRRHLRRRHAHVSTGKFRSEKSADFSLHSRRSARRRWQPVRSRLVSVGSSRRHCRLARLRAQLSRLHRLWRQVRAPDRS